MDDKRYIEAEIKWFNKDKGYGVATSGENKLLVLSIYIEASDVLLEEGDRIKCFPVEVNGILHATKVNLLLKNTNDLLPKTLK